ncbi:uncharacterized protein LOC128230090 [Mya arenaria]|uniref:uncharacterized protein LOC128230090 n=1 Tax=Mya arenaria TaxID=6604 RepID=UPI0022E5861E|nr:uncharacterized protein LOC128230090 [Mya arenaria]
MWLSIFLLVLEYYAACHSFLLDNPDVELQCHVHPYVCIEQSISTYDKQQCNHVMALNCFIKYLDLQDHRVCGSNGITYLNKCFFAKAHCNHPFLSLEYEGHCNETTTTTTPATTTSAVMPTTDSTSCLQNIQMECGSEITPICASNNNWYLNMCEFRKAQCEDHTIHFAFFGMC